MPHTALQVIHAEHNALAAVLSTMSMLMSQYERNGATPDFSALRAMVFYIDEFPERLHHQRESQLLFPILRSRTSAADDVLARLDREHAQGERAVRDLAHALLAYEMMGPPRAAGFEYALRRYTDFYLSHMALEEAEVLPLASKVLTEDDWRMLDAAFADNRDPLAGHAARDEYEGLFSRIARLVPAPYGLADPVRQ